MNLRATLITRLREIAGNDLADKVAHGKLLSDFDQCRLDACIYGNGYTVDGKRVDPSRVSVYRFDGKSIEHRHHPPANHPAGDWNAHE